MELDYQVIWNLSQGPWTVLDLVLMARYSGMITSYLVNLGLGITGRKDAILRVLSSSILCLLLSERRPRNAAVFKDAYRLQLKLFLYEVKQQQLLAGVRTFLKVYSTISLTKLSTYMEVDEANLRLAVSSVFGSVRFTTKCKATLDIRLPYSQAHHP